MNSILKNASNKSILWGIVMAMPIVIYGYFLAEYAVNIPKWDDHALKAFILDFHNADGIVSKIQTLFKQHNEHRIAFDRLITLFIYTLHGSIEYRWLMWVGNCSLIGIALLFYRLLQKKQLPLLAFAPVVFTLFQLQLWENTFWGMASVQNFGVVFFILGLIYLISSPKKHYFYIALLVAFLATYTSGNGILAFPVCIALLVLQKRFRETVIFGIISMFLVASYFYHYQAPANNPSMKGIGISNILIGFCSFNGAVFDVLPHSQYRISITIATGIILVVIAGLMSIYWIINSKFFKKSRELSQVELFALGCFIFLLGTAFVVTYTRISYGAIGLLTSRYKIYSILLLLTIYLTLISKVSESTLKLVLIPLLFTSIGFNVISNFSNFEAIVNLRKQLVCFTANETLNPIKEAVKLPIKLYEKPIFWYQNEVLSLKRPLQQAEKWQEKITQQATEQGFIFENQSFKIIQNKDNGAYIIAQSPNKTYLFPTQQHINSVFSSLRTRAYWRTGFNITIDKNEFEAGTYHLGILVKTDKDSKIYALNDSLSIKESTSKTIKTNW
jgi:hypothetical protein